MSESMHARYHVTERDYVRVGRVASRPGRRAWTVLAVVLACALAAALLGPPGTGTAVTGGLVGGLAVWCTIQYVLNPWLLRRHYRQYKLMQQEQTVTLSPDVIHFKSAAGESHLGWDKILKWRFSPDYVLIYLAPNMYHVIPASVAAQGFDLDRLKSTLAQHVGPAV